MFENNNDNIKFINRWALKPKKDPKIKQKISTLEKVYGIELPDEYLSLIKESNPIYCPGLLDYISEKNLDIYDVQNFTDPDKIKEETDAYINAGMPIGYIGFASDCMGNMFCFNSEEVTRKKEIKIYIYDHDFNQINEVADSFNNWIKQFNKI